MKLDNEVFINRLYEDLKLYKGKIIVAVDYDDTISPWKVVTKEFCQEVINVIIRAQKSGAYITIFTNCNSDRHEEIKSYCYSKGIRIDSININPIQLPYGNEEHSKIFYNILLDDRAGLLESINILDSALVKYRMSDLVTHTSPIS